MALLTSSMKKIKHAVGLFGKITEGKVFLLAKASLAISSSHTNEGKIINYSLPFQLVLLFCASLGRLIKLAKPVVRLCAG